MGNLFKNSANRRLSSSHQEPASGRLLFRLLIGLIQGALAYGLYKVTDFKAMDTGWLVAWVLVTAYAPPLWLAAIGQIPLRSTLIWGSIATVVLAALGLASGYLPELESSFVPLVICMPIALFCAHHLVVPAIATRQLIAPFEAYYETAWKAGIQLVLALMFLGVFWLILFLGVMLFGAIGLDIVEDIVTDPLFVSFATPIFFALGVELSDVREGLTQGIRTVALTLLGWLLPIAVFIAAAFLIALPIAGLSELQSSLSPAGLMLAASAGLILLINTVYQDGAENLSPSPVLRITLRIGAFLLVPMTAFALWAVAVRIGQYGLTVSRIVALTASVIGLLYALGYSLAQLVGLRSRGQWQEGGWMPLFERTNIFVGALTALILIGFSTPWLNPIKLSLESQLARVSSGRLAPDAIPYNWLARNAGQRGRDLLKDLSKSEDQMIAVRAHDALEGRYYSRPDKPQHFKMILLPEGTPIPEGLEEALKSTNNSYECRIDEGCKVRLFDIDADGRAEALVSSGSTPKVFRLDDNGTWKFAGTFSSETSCPPRVVNGASLLDNVPTQTEHSTVKPVIIGNATYLFRPETECGA